MRGVVQRVFREHYPAYRRTRRMAWREERAAFQIRTCRTEAQGHHVYRCPGGDYEERLPNACKHRSCPTCGSRETDRWIAAQDARVLPGPYHQIVFTIPDGLHPLWLYNRRAFTNLLFRAAWESLRAFTDDPRWLGATPGAIGGLHSWSDTLALHVHLHLLVTAGGLDESGRWVKSQASFFCPALALSCKFRGRFLALLRQAVDKGRLALVPGATAAFWRSKFNKYGREKWHVMIEPAYEHAHGVVRYLGAYLRRGPIGESRIERYDGHTLTVAYKHPGKQAHPTFELDGQEFVRRFLVHVPLKGQRVVRHFGLFHHHQRDRLEQARAVVVQALAAAGVRLRAPKAVRLEYPVRRCPRCGEPLVLVGWHFPSRAPPERQAA